MDLLNIRNERFGNKHKIYKLKNTLYGLNQSIRYMVEPVVMV